jgi:hypothetical protein
MNLTEAMPSYKSIIKSAKYKHKIVAVLPAGLLLCLCGCMLWQCSACLLKYIEEPTGASIAYNQDFSLAPISVTVCSKNPDLTYSFPELASVDYRLDARAAWKPIWSASSLKPAAISADTFVTSDSKKQLHLCMKISVNISSGSELRIRHYYTDLGKCNLKNMEVYLHKQGIFFAPDFSLPLDKSLFLDNKNFTVGVTIETMESLPTKEFNCSPLSSQTLDSCLLEKAWKAAHQSAGCIAKYLR